MSTLLDAADTADKVANDSRQISDKLRDMDARRRQGWSWERIVSSDNHPSLPTLIGGIIKHVGELLRKVQQSVSRGLSSEGASHGRIAEYFNVSRQRISKLLSKSTGSTSSDQMSTGSTSSAPASGSGNAGSPATSGSPPWMSSSS